MKILVTGARGFVGKNLCESLKNVRDGKDRTRGVTVTEVLEADVDTSFADLKEYCRKADFVFHLAGVNRPQDDAEFAVGNCGALAGVLDLLKEAKNTCPVVLSSSVQATLVGRFSESVYGKSKREAEDILFSYAKETGAFAYVYRFTNLFGKWCRPNYNSVVATFCHNVARNLPITVSDPSVSLTLTYIDDLVDEMFCVLKGAPHRCTWEGDVCTAKEDGNYCFVPVFHTVTLGEIVTLLEGFSRHAESLEMPEAKKGSFEKKLFATYLSDLPKEKIAFDLKMNCDARGSFTEVLRTASAGQVSVNVSYPGITKGEHWHHTKWEFFVVVSGRGLMQMRKIGTDEVIEFEVSGEELRAVYMLPGYTHNLINLSDTENLVTLMWANECFDKEKPDTFFEGVQL